MSSYNPLGSVGTDAFLKICSYLPVAEQPKLAEVSRSSRRTIDAVRGRLLRFLVRMDPWAEQILSTSKEVNEAPTLTKKLQSLIQIISPPENSVAKHVPVGGEFGSWDVEWILRNLRNVDSKHLYLSGISRRDEGLLENFRSKCAYFGPDEVFEDLIDQENGTELEKYLAERRLPKLPNAVLSSALARALQLRNFSIAETLFSYRKMIRIDQAFEEAAQRGDVRALELLHGELSINFTPVNGYNLGRWARGLHVGLVKAVYANQLGSIDTIMKKCPEFITREMLVHLRKLACDVQEYVDGGPNPKQLLLRELPPEGSHDRTAIIGRIDRELARFPVPAEEEAPVAPLMAAPAQVVVAAQEAVPSIRPFILGGVMFVFLAMINRFLREPS